MFTKITQKSKVRGEGGFTLIELLVVIIIIAILAAIAIPMYLSQRQKGWDANVQSDLRNAAVAQESYFTGPPGGSYTNNAAGELGANGFNGSASVTVTVISASSAGYCMSGVHSSNPGKTWYFDSDDGTPTTVACT